jgi:8-oxo-dGTP pyrophosphatase MutT (NUDIX family)
MSAGQPPAANPESRPPRNVTSVGALVVRDGCLLVVRMTYGPSVGRWMIPGGLLDPGETLDAAAAREVLEETGIVARPLGIVGLRSRTDGLNTDNYVLWLLEPLDHDGEPTPDQREIEEARYMPFAEIADREDVVYLVKYLAARLASGAIALHPHVTDYTYQFPGTTPETWKLFM